MTILIPLSKLIFGFHLSLINAFLILGYTFIFSSRHSKRTMFQLSTVTTGCLLESGTISLQLQEPYSLELT